MNEHHDVAKAGPSGNASDGRPHEFVSTTASRARSRLSTGCHWQQGKIPTPFLVRPGPDSERPSVSPGDDEDEQRTHGFYPGSGHPEVNSPTSCFDCIMGLSRVVTVPLSKAWPTNRCSSATLRRWKKNRSKSKASPNGVSRKPNPESSQVQSQRAE